MVLLGALIKAMGLDSLDWTEVLRGIVPPKLFDLNVKALRAGMAL